MYEVWSRFRLTPYFICVKRTVEERYVRLSFRLEVFTTSLDLRKSASTIFQVGLRVVQWSDTTG